MSKKTPKPLTMGVAARLAGVAPATASRWLDAGTLKGYRIPLSKDRRVEVEDLREFLVRSNMPTTRLDEYLAALPRE